MGVILLSNMKYLFRQFVPFISIITSIGFCNENFVTISIPLYNNTATFTETQAVVDKYPTLNYFINNDINVTNNTTEEKNMILIIIVKCMMN